MCRVCLQSQDIVLKSYGKTRGTQYNQGAIAQDNVLVTSLPASCIGATNYWLAAWVPHETVLKMIHHVLERIDICTRTQNLFELQFPKSLIFWLIRRLISIKPTQNLLRVLKSRCRNKSRKFFLLKVNSDQEVNSSCKLKISIM